MMRSRLHAYFFDPPQGPFVTNPWWKYGFLAIACGMLAFQVWLLVWFDPGYSGYRFLGIASSGILLGQLLIAFFYFGPRLTFPVRLCAGAIQVVASAYVLYSLLMMMN